ASAIPIGMPGWPDLARSTASIDKARMAFAIRAKSSSLMSAGAPPLGAAMESLKADAGKVNAAPARALVRFRGLHALRACKGQGPRGAALEGGQARPTKPRIRSKFGSCSHGHAGKIGKTARWGARRP